MLRLSAMIVIVGQSTGQHLVPLLKPLNRSFITQTKGDGVKDDVDAYFAGL